MGISIINIYDQSTSATPDIPASSMVVYPIAGAYIDGVPDGFITIPRSGTLDYQGATFFDRNFHFNLPTDLTNVSKLLFTGYFSTYRVTVDADSVTNNAVCQSGVTTEIPINQAYIGGNTANISINVII